MAFVAAVLASLSGPGAAFAAPVEEFLLRNQDTGHCLDARSRTLVGRCSGLPGQIWTAPSGANMTWLRNEEAEACLTATPSGQVVLNRCGLGGDMQLWTYGPDAETAVRSAANHRALTDQGRRGLVTSALSGARNQLWERLPPG
ncbi:RICIN domain-containing protein [Streptoalloteichus hindustanus]|nr:ricin-type beta-trefoil lectin domain protein [Streptoalloteichus hindustanus]